MTLQQNLFNALIIGYSLIIFLLDYISPIGVAIGSLYIIVIVASSFLVHTKKELFIITSICGLLIILGYFFSETNENQLEAIVNRVISLFIVLVGCLMGAAFLSNRVKEKALDKQFQLAMEAAPNAMVMVDSSGNIIFANKQMQSLFLYEEDELLNNSIDLLVPDSFRAHHDKYRNQFLNDPKPRAMGTGRDLFGLKKDGSQVPIEIGLTPIKTSRGLFIVSAIVDLSERRKSEKQLLSLNTKLSEKNVELEQFVYTVSHDLKAPLVSISGFTKKLKQSDLIQSDEQVARYVERVLVNINKMEELIKDLLSLSRISHRELELEEICLKETLDHCISLLGPQIKSLNATITVDKDLPRLIGQGNLIEQIFTNLISNSLKYKRNDVQPKVNIGLHSKLNNSITIFVQDNGLGIEKEHYLKVFEIFERLTPDKCEGSGVGLAIVKKIVEKHAGKIWLESEINIGTTFYIKLPLNINAQNNLFALERSA